MHDIPEGVARYDMAVVINCLIQAKYFTLDELIVAYNFLNTG